MTTQEVKRKLAAILSADVKGYSRLMGEDEVGTIHTLNAYKETMARLIQHHHGRVVDAPGDNLLAEFSSVVEAVQCAVEIQKELKTQNADLPENRRMEFRIGVNLGDVVEEGDTIYGDGVNIAARLESLAEAGGICISGTAFDQVKNKLNLGYEYLGEQTVKNILEPVRVYRVLMEPEAAGKVIGEKKIETRRWQRPALALVAILILIASVVTVWQFALKPSLPDLEKADPKKMVLPLPDKPSIAVLPFVNMSDDPKQEYLSDGITENIITGLSKVPRLFVMSRQSTFPYKGKPVKIKQVSEDLGVKYVLEGSVQRSGDRIRINTQLIDALTGRHLWAERYDRDLKDLFAVQDEITMKILTAIRVKLTEGETSILQSKYYRGKQGFDCWLKIMEAYKYFFRYTIEDNNAARRLAEEAISMCPDNPEGYALLGVIYGWDIRLENTKSPGETFRKAMEFAQKALAMDDSLPIVHIVLAVLYLTVKEYDKANAEAERAVALDPSGWGSYAQCAQVLTYACRPEEAIPMFQKAIRLNPNASGSALVSFGEALRMTGRYEEAISEYKKALQSAPDFIRAHIGLVITYTLMGREKEARAEVEEILRINPKFSLDHYAKTVNYKDQSEIDKIVKAMRNAGLK